jgi:hypothetical protein
MEACTIAAATLAIITGAFGTGGLPLLPRIAFWTMLIGWNWIKWRLWIAATIRRPGDWLRSMALAAIVLNLPLPLEIGLCARIVGMPVVSISSAVVWLQTAAISLFLGAALIWLRSRQAGDAEPLEPADGPATDDGLFARLRIAPQTISTILAEDHYCRIQLADGSERLVYCRFRDLVAALPAREGTQIHRGVWVADRAIAGAKKLGRKWHLGLHDSRQLPVSTSHLAEARRRGWLGRAG